MAKSKPTVGEAPAARVCPECGGETWKTIDLTLARTEAGDTSKQQKELDAIIAKRGQLQRCVSCGYKAHANDDLSPAVA